MWPLCNSQQTVMWPLCNSQQTVMWPLCNSQQSCDHCVIVKWQSCDHCVIVKWHTPHHFNDLQQLVQKRAMLVKSLEYRTFTTHVTLSNRWVVSSLILHKAELTFPRMVTKWLHMVRIKQWSRPFSVNIFTIVTTTPWGNREARVLLWNTPCVGLPSTLSLASFPGSHTPEREHWSCAGVESLVFFVTWKTPKIDAR